MHYSAHLLTRVYSKQNVFISILQLPLEPGEKGHADSASGRSLLTHKV